MLLIAARILISTLLPLPLLVCSFLLVGDIFHVNYPDPDHLRLSESYEAGYLHIDFLYVLAISSVFLSVPLVIFSVILEFACKNSASRYLAGLIFGWLIGTFVGYISTDGLSSLSRLELAEAFSHLTGSIAVMVLVVIAMEFFRKLSQKAEPATSLRIY